VHQADRPGRRKRSSIVFIAVCCRTGVELAVNREGSGER
jgi:hypothetical protein